MAQASWHQIKPILEAVLEAPDSLRQEILERKCGQDASLRRSVEEYLGFEQEADELFEEVSHALLAESPMGSGDVGDPFIGHLIDDYRVAERLGRGGMGTVYLAEREGEFSQKVALKVIRRGMDTDEIVGRFQMERQILAHLEHPNIARLLDGGSTRDGLPYFVMEHIDGVPLDAYCDRRQLGINARLELFLKVCDAVEAAHRRLIVHRDLKPSNLLVTADGTVKLLDFGIAKLLSDDQQALSVRTRPEERIMTPRYASPEQVRGEPITTASDVYSLGVVLFQLLTGHSPYRLETLTDETVARHVREEDPQRPSTVVGLDEEISTSHGKTLRIDAQEVAESRGLDARTLKSRLSGDLDAIVLKALAKEPERRYLSVERLAQDLRRHQQGLPVEAVAPTIAYRSRRYLQRNALPVAIVSGLFLALVIYALTVSVLLDQAEEAKAEALTSEKQAVAARDQAEEALGLLSNILIGAKPDNARGAGVSFNQLLKQGIEQIGRLESSQTKAVMQRTLGDVFRAREEKQRAQDLFQGCLSTLEDLGSENSHLATFCRLHQGSLLLDKGDYSAALKHIRPSVKALEIHYQGVDALNLAKALNALGRVYFKQNDFDQAEIYLRRALEMKERMAKASAEDKVLLNDRAMFVGLNNLAAVLIAQGRNEEAADMLQGPIDQQRSLPPEEIFHSDFASALSNLGRAQFQLGRLEQAQANFDESVHIRRRLYPEGNRTVAFALINSSKPHLQKEQQTEALEDLIESEHLLEREKKPNYRLLGIAKTSLAEAFAALESFDQGLAKASEALEAFKHVKTLKPWRIPMTQHIRGACIARIQDPAAGERLMLESLEAMEAEGASNLDLERALKRMADFYDWRGEAAEAAALRDQARALTAPDEAQAQ